MVRAMPPEPSASAITAAESVAALEAGLTAAEKVEWEKFKAKIAAESDYSDYSSYYSDSSDYSDSE